ncbi:MAG: glycosyltransferase family 39 protein [Anaerolineaceae bacterium]|nr:MAG: glycosyltransferase family 39 protein [Anaerolineaceae bacterium]
MDTDNYREHNQNVNGSAECMGCGQSPHPTHNPFSIRRMLFPRNPNLDRRSFATILLIIGALVLAVSLHLLSSSPHVVISSTLLCIGVAAILWGILVTFTRHALDWAKGALEKTASLLDVSTLQPVFFMTGLSLSLATRAAAGDGRHIYSPIANVLWVLGITLTIVGCWRWARNEVTNSDPTVRSGNKSRWEIVGIVGLFFVSLLLRGWAADRMPYVLNDEEASIGMVGWEFVTGGRDNLFSSAWGSYPTLYFWLLSVSQILFGRTVNAIRWVSAFGGALTVIALYWTARHMFGRRVAIWSAAWLLAFHHHLFFSRVAYNNIWDGCFLILIVGALWKGWNSDDRRYYLLAGLALGLSQFFYITSRLFPVLILLWSILALFRSPNRRYLASHLISFWAVAIVVALPLAFHYFSNPEQWLINAQYVSILNPDLKQAAAALGTTPIGLVFEQIWVTALGFTVGELQGVYYGSGVPLLFGISTVFFLLGVLGALLHFREARYNIPILALIATILIGGFSTQAPNAQRMLLLPPMLALLVVHPLEEISSRFSDYWERGRVLIFITMSVVVLLMMTENLQFFYRDYLPREAYGSYKGEIAQAMVEILDDEGQEVEVYLVSGGRLPLDSLTSLHYQIPDIIGWDLESPFELPDSAGPSGTRRLFFILPEQIDAIMEIELKYTGGLTFPRYNRHERLLFYVGSTDQP